MNGEYEDDPAILDDARLWRLLPPNWVLTDPETGEKRITSQAFQNQKGHDALSIVLADRLLKSGRDMASVLENWGGFGLAMITAGVARQFEQGVCADPTDDEEFHGLVFGKKSKATKRGLAESAQLLVDPA